MNADYRVPQEIAEIPSKFCFSFNNLRLGTYYYYVLKFKTINLK